MKHYEYKTMTWAAHMLADGSFAVSFDKWLNEQGAQGWHLSAMENQSASMQRRFFCVFARLVEAERKG